MTFSKVRTPSTNWTALSPSTVSQAELEKFDRNAQRGINGDRGGAYVLLSTLRIDSANATVPVDVTGPTVVSGSLAVLELKDAGSYIRHDDGDDIVLGVTHEGRTRAFVHSFMEADPSPRDAFRARDDATLLSIRQGTPTPTLILPIRGHHGATLASVSVRFRVAAQRAAAPTLLPRVRVLRVSDDGSAVPLTSPAAGADSDGWVSPSAPSSASAWYALGAQKTLAITCDQNNLVDVGSYWYELEAQDRDGGVPAFEGRAATTTNVTLSGPQTIDGVPLVAGEYALVRAQANPVDNGLYVVAAGAWTRATELDASAEFVPGLVVRVREGTKLVDTVHELKHEQASDAWTPATAFALNDARVPRIANGYVYKITVAGTSGATEPVWPTTIGSTVADSGCTWTNIGTTETFLVGATKANFAQLALVAAPGILNVGLVWECAVASYSGITNGGPNQ